LYLLQEITNSVVVRSIKDVHVGLKGRPNTYVTRILSDVIVLVNEDCRYTVEDIASKVGILEGSAHTSLTQNLGIKKGMRKLGPQFTVFFRYL
jgi:hypothetical protein